MDPREYERMFALEERHWWYRALRRRLFHALRAVPWSEPPGVPGAGAAQAPATGPAQMPRAWVLLDAGCGTGMNLQAIVTRGAREIGRPVQVYGFDASHLALRLAARRGLHRLACASVEAIPWPDACADLVLSTDVIYHQGVRDDRVALREMARCLRPGGMLILNVPAFAWLRSAHDVAIHTARRYTRRMLIARLRDAGLEPVRVGYWNWLLFAPLAAVRLARALIRRPASPAGSTAPGSASSAGSAVPARAPASVPASVPASDLGAVPLPLNAALDALLALEAALGPLPVPAGLSLMALARKPAQEQQR